MSRALNDGPAAADETRALLDRLQPSLPILMANLTSLDQVGITYRNDLEQLLVLLPPGIAILQGAGLANRNTKQAYKGGYLSFNLNLNLPPACTTGFLPPQQQRVPTDVDYPPRPPGNVYCRVPQDAPFNVRGARNIPCETKPGNAHRPPRCAKATRITSRSTTATTGRATRTRPRPVKPSRNCRRAHQVPPHYRLHRSR